jgi:hypothetical protein
MLSIVYLFNGEIYFNKSYNSGFASQEKQLFL